MNFSACSLFIITLILFSSQSFAEEEITIPVSSDMEISVNRYVSDGEYLALWLAPEYGFRAAHRSFAQSLVKENIEVWQSNIVESLFLPQGTSSLKQLDGKYIADIMEYAHKLTGKKIILIGDSYAASNALIGAHYWQTRKHSGAYLVGAILFSPYTYTEIPPLGVQPEYLPIISSTNIPLMIYQTKNSGNINQFNLVLQMLSQHENPVYTKFIPEVMSLFYEEEPSHAMKAQAKPLPRNIKKMISVLDRHGVPEKAIPLKAKKSYKSGLDINLKKFQGTKTPIAINLSDINGKTFVKSDYKGQVTLINFWATWCPPCVEEIPSLNRLNKKMNGFSFELISINYAEDKSTILEFMNKINVEYPVLLDNSGKFAQRWNVIAYPSTFVIDSKGHIIYGVNSAIEWDNPEIIKILKSLI